MITILIFVATIGLAISAIAVIVAAVNATLLVRKLFSSEISYDDGEKCLFKSFKTHMTCVAVCVVGFVITIVGCFLLATQELLK